jgi:cell division protein FtsN
MEKLNQLRDMVNEWEMRYGTQLYSDMLHAIIDLSGEVLGKVEKDITEKSKQLDELIKKVSQPAKPAPAVPKPTPAPAPAPAPTPAPTPEEPAPPATPPVAATSKKSK